MPVQKSMESLEATLFVANSDSEEDLSSLTMFSDENWEGYSTPTGSIPILDAKEPDKESSIPHEDDTVETTPVDSFWGGRDSADNDDAHSLTIDMPESIPSLQNLLAENIQLRSRIEELEQQKPGTAFNEDIQELRRQLDEANSYVDQVDIEAEQQYTELTSEIDELCTLVETKESEITRLKELLQEKKRENEKLQELYDQQKTNSNRQTEVIENLRDELDVARGRLRDVAKERERQQADVAAMKAQIESDKGDILAKEVMLTMELEEVQRELNRQKEILDGSDIAILINRWERRARDLENQVSERDVIVHTQQAIINKLRSQSPPSRGNTMASGSSSSESFHSNGLTPGEKNTIFNFVLSDRHNQLANIYALGRVLDLTPSEEHYLEKVLSGRTNRLY